MNKIPLYIGVLMIMPIAMQAETDERKKLHNGYGVGAVMAADAAILHEAIKDNIRRQALLVWVDAQGRKAPTQAIQAMETLIGNIRYVSIENTWYRIVREVNKVSLFRKAIAGTGVMVKQNDGRSAGVTPGQGAYSGHFSAPVAGAELIPPQAEEHQKVVITAFTRSGDLTADQEMAMVVECYQKY